MPQFNLETATINELKAACYDIIVQIEQLQKNLQILNQAINQKSKEVKTEPKCEHNEWEEYKGNKFCKKCGDVLSGEICNAPNCINFGKPLHKICVEG